MYTRKQTKSEYIKGKIKVLKDFYIDITPEIEMKIENLYPNERAIENYLRTVILDKLGK